MRRRDRDKKKPLGLANQEELQKQKKAFQENLEKEKKQQVQHIKDSQSLYDSKYNLKRTADVLTDYFSKVLAVTDIENDRSIRELAIAFANLYGNDKKIRSDIATSLSKLTFTEEDFEKIKAMYTNRTTDHLFNLHINQRFNTLKEFTEEIENRKDEDKVAAKAVDEKSTSTQSTGEDKSLLKSEELKDEESSKSMETEIQSTDVEKEKKQSSPKPTPKQPTLFDTQNVDTQKAIAKAAQKKLAEMKEKGQGVRTDTTTPSQKGSRK